MSMTENVCNLLDNLTKHNSRAFGYELSQNEVLQILKLFDDVKELKQYRAIGTRSDFIYFKEQNKYLLKENETQRDLIDKYEAIGTIEELKALKEKSVAKKPLNDGMQRPFSYYCPNCKEELSDDGYEPDEEYCCNCGQHILIEN